MSVNYADYKALIESRRASLRERIPALIQGSTPFVWEVGSGHGHFLTAYAQANPTETCIGVDITPERVERASRKQGRARLGNLTFLLADADDFLAALPPEARISRVFVLFPDPWPKRRHHKNRLIRPDFLATLASFALRGAALYFRTDHEPYFEEARKQFRSAPDWREVPGSMLPFESKTVFEERAPQYFTCIFERR
jgi:tRNA (guanine-N7-)-methyltransferase